MKREWKPGDVAELAFASSGEVARGVRCSEGWQHDGDFGAGSAYDDIGGFTVRPLVVLDPEDREQVERLTGALVLSGAGKNDANHWPEVQAALRSLVEPPPEVYEHFVIDVSGDATGDILRSRCGKVWRPADGATVVGRCPECVKAVELGWAS